MKEITEKEFQIEQFGIAKFCLPLFIAYNMLEDKTAAWIIHSIFNITMMVGYGTAFAVRRSEIMDSTRASIHNSLFDFREDDTQQQAYKGY